MLDGVLVGVRIQLKKSVQCMQNLSIVGFKSNYYFLILDNFSLATPRRKIKKMLKYMVNLN